MTETPNLLWISSLFGSNFALGLAHLSAQWTFDTFWVALGLANFLPRPALGGAQTRGLKLHPAGTPVSNLFEAGWCICFILSFSRETSCTVKP